MPPFSTRTLGIVRRNVNAMLTDTCTIYSEGSGRDSSGAPLHTLESVASDVACRIIRSTSRAQTRAQTVAGQEALVELYRLILPVGTPFTVNDVVELSSGERYQVVNVEDKLTDSAFVEASITRVRS